MTAMDRAMHRALAEAGLAPLDDYVRQWAPPAGEKPVLEDPRSYPERHQVEDEQPDAEARKLRTIVLAALLGFVVAFATVAILAMPTVGSWIERQSPAWEVAR